MRLLPAVQMIVIGLCVFLPQQHAAAQYATPPKTPGDRLVQEYFRLETEKLTEQALDGIDSLADWEAVREEYRRQLRDMLGLDPLPAKTPMQPVVTKTLERDGIIVENIHFQSMPGLYVTGNLYRPKTQNEPLPAILYVCGHGGERVDGVSVGNKTHYQHHGAWFAKNGYVCLTIDTIQLGEIEGLHHGTYREKMWWWNNRGYTPAGVEAWNCVRSLDYLQSRPEVDGERLGVTGRSGGGAYSWWIAAIDPRIKAAVPVAGITSLRNHVVDGCVEGHCDCMFMVNTYRWDFPIIAALVAPRPLLIANTDKDRIFPLDGVVDVYSKARPIYELYGKPEHIGLYITEGPHKDTQQLRIGAFRWLNRFLKQDEALIETAARPVFDKAELKVFDSLPADERVTSIQESFVPQAGDDASPTVESIRKNCFRGWPDSPENLQVDVVGEKDPPARMRLIRFTSQTPYRLPIVTLENSQTPDAALVVTVLGQAQWEKLGPAFAAAFPEQFPNVEPDEQALRTLAESSADADFVYLMPRGIGPTEWDRDPRERTHIRRRFMLLGQTVAGMQVYDTVRALQAIQQTPDFADRQITLRAAAPTSTIALYASLFVDNLAALQLAGLPDSHRTAPPILNVSRVATFNDVVELANDLLDSNQN
jgi:dienelactone hydrolase